MAARNRVRVAPLLRGKHVRKTLIPTGELSAEEEKRTKLGAMEDIEWGWLAHERRERRVYWFKLWDGIMAASVVIHVTIIAFCAAFSPYDMSLLALSYVLDLFNCADFCVKIWRFYAHDMRNAEMRRGKSKLDWYTHTWLPVDLIAVAPTDIICPVVGSTLTMPTLAYLRCNRLFCGYRVFRVSCVKVTSTGEHCPS